MSPIHSLPVELLARIFQIGVDEDPLPDRRPPNTPTFEVLVSHVCRHWRDVALNTPPLWTVIHFRTVPHLVRARSYLARSARHLLDIHVDTASEDDHIAGHTLFRDEFDLVFECVVPHIRRWRALYLKVRDLQCKGGARHVLSTCGPAPALQTLQLWHIEDWRTAERLYTAIGPPPVVVFDASLPALRHISLIGVNLPWARSPFLRSLVSIELAIHSDEVRIPFDLWRSMLAGSPQLERLVLHYSGPRASAPGGIEEWGALPGDATANTDGNPPAALAPVLLQALREIRLTDLDPPYLVALLRTFAAPNARILHLDLSESEQDFTPFVEFLADPRPHPIALAPGASAEDARGAVFPHLEVLSVAALDCSLKSWRALLVAFPKVRRLEVDFSKMAGFFAVLFDIVPVREGEKEKGKEREGVGARLAPLLPELNALRVTGVPGVDLAALATKRRAMGHRVARWLVDEGDKDAEGVRLEMEMEELTRVERELRAAEGDMWEPWREDEDGERLEWMSAEDEEDGDDEGALEGSYVEEEEEGGAEDAGAVPDGEAGVGDYEYGEDGSGEDDA